MSLKDLLEPMTATATVVYEDGSSNHTEDDPDLPEQSIPSESTCPYCGGDPTDESQTKHRLSAVGYLHDDIEMTCTDCGRNWPCGVPIGDYDGESDLFCDSCESRYMRVHRVAIDTQRERVMLNLKCPNPECYYYKKVQRETDDRNIALVGYPDITGSTDGAEPYGY